MSDSDWLTEIFVCPSCRGDLSAQTLRCIQCGNAMPQPGKLPWIFRDPLAAQAAWTTRFRQFASVMRQEGERCALALQSNRLTTATQRRLEQRRHNYAEQITLVSKILQPLGVKPPERGQALDDALQGQLARSQNLLSYFDNIHRDWSWADGDNDENRATASILSELIGNAPRHLALLGAGSGRLALDLHQRLAPTHTIAIDLNPLMLYTARRVLNGQSVELYEFPLAPIDDLHAAVKHRIKRKDKAPPNLHLALADISENPFRPGAIDTVVTPWLIDIIDLDLPDLAAIINSAMPLGGHWINHGSLVFNQADPRRQYLYDEVRTLIADAGFAMRVERFDTLPYLQSPASNQRRLERVWSFVAEKIAARPAPSVTSRLPGFLDNPALPIPATAYFRQEHLSHVMLAPLLGLIDGRRNLSDLAAYLHSEYGMESDEAQHYARKLLLAIYERSSGHRVFG